MAQYTTGELAKECGITVRTVQFYDQRGLLVPSALTEGGRRLYSEEDLKMMKIICFLRDTGLSLDTIGKLLKEEDLGSVVSIFLEQQEQVLQEEIADRKDKLERKSIGDIATVMENKKKLSAVHRKMVLVGAPFTVAEDAGILLWIFKGQWWLFAAALAAAIPVIIWMVRYYYRNAAYICPQCHEVFKPAMKEFFYANHTLKTRKLACVKCGHKGYCVETYGGNVE